MAEWPGLGPFLGLSVAVSLFWGRSLHYLDERSGVLRRGVFLAMTITRRDAGEVRALLLSAAYYGLGLLASAGFAAVFGPDMPAMLAVRPRHAPFVVLGVVAEVSLADLFVAVGCRLSGRGAPSDFEELRDVPWMKGLRALPAGLGPPAAAVGGAVEELFFRGVLLLILKDVLGLHPMAAVAVAGLFFALEQLVQVQTPFQAMVIAAGCAAISLVGGLLVVSTGSVMPAVLCHVSFVVFFLARGGPARAG